MNVSGHHRDDIKDKETDRGKAWSKPRKRSLMEVEGKEDAQKCRVRQLLATPERVHNQETAETCQPSPSRTAWKILYLIGTFLVNSK